MLSAEVAPIRRGLVPSWAERVGVGEAAAAFDTVSPVPTVATEKAPSAKPAAMVT